MLSNLFQLNYYHRYIKPLSYQCSLDYKDRYLQQKFFNLMDCKLSIKLIKDLNTLGMNSDMLIKLSLYYYVRKAIDY